MLTIVTTGLLLGRWWFFHAQDTNVDLRPGPSEPQHAANIQPDRMFGTYVGRRTRQIRDAAQQRSARDRIVAVIEL